MVRFDDYSFAFCISVHKRCLLGLHRTGSHCPFLDHSRLGQVRQWWFIEHSGKLWGALVAIQRVCSSALSPSRVQVNHQNDVWSTLLVWVEQYIIVQCCVKDVEYVFIMPLFTFAINESIICNSTQTIKLSEYIFHSLLEHISTVGKSKWQPFPSVLSYGVLEVQRRLLSSSRFTFQNLLRASRMLKWEAPLTLGMTSFMVLT